MKTTRLLFVALLSLLLGKINTAAQSIPRRVFLGIRMENLTEDSRNIMGIDTKGGVLISEVFPNSTGEAAGFRKGDILLKINDRQLSSTSDVVSFLATQNTGTGFSYDLYRDRKQLKGKSVYKAMPEEHYAGLDMIYSGVKTPAGNQRIIISKAKGTTSKLPTILFIGGIGCYSLDFPFDSGRSEVRLLNDLTRAGYLCARAEKPGMGDNAGSSKPCNEVSFTEEMEGYTYMVNALKSRPDVDPDAIFILGHSMGGVFAPLIAQQTGIKGIIAYGTIGSNFPEYLMKTRKTIAEAYNMSPQESDDLVKSFCECAVYYFSDKLSAAETEKRKPGCKELMSVFDLRSRAYNDELYALKIPALWQSFAGKSLLLWGTADYISSEDDHAMIASVANKYHNGNSTFVKVPDSDHGMMQAAGFTGARNNPGMYNSEVSKVVINWLQKQL